MTDFSDIRDELVADASNAWATALGYAPLFSASAESRIAIIGQAPGRRAQKSGIPWNDPSGDLPPRRDFAARWHPGILSRMTDLRLTVLVGGYAQKHYLGAAAGPNLTETVRAFREYLPGSIPLVHPSPLNFRWRARNPWFEADVIPELQSHVRAALTKTKEPVADQRAQQN